MVGGKQMRQDHSSIRLSAIVVTQRYYRVSLLAHPKMSQEHRISGNDNIIELTEFYDANPTRSVAEDCAVSAPENQLSSAPNAKGGYYLLYQGYSFTRNDTNHNPANTHYWRCTAFTSPSKCRARLTTLGDYRLGVDHLIVKPRPKPVPHSCSPSASKRQLLFEMCKVIMTSPRESKIMDAYWKVTKEAREEDILQLPRRETTYEWLRRFKKAHFGIPASPKHRTGFDIPDEYQYVVFGDQTDPESVKYHTLLWDSGADDGHRIICFYNPWALEHIYDKPGRAHLAMDGTYKVCPRNWVQQYTILCMYPGGTFYPVFYALLSDHTKASYCRLLTRVRGVLPDYAQVATVVLDFESGSVPAVHEIFPEARISLCYFHLSQNVFEHLAKLIPAMTPVERRSEPQVRVAFRAYYNVMALPFLPEALVYQGFLEAVGDLPPQVRRDFSNYFIRTYLQGTERAQFSPDRWNMRERALSGFPRTNNSQEGFHHKWNTLFTADVPPIIWTWIDVVLENMREVRSDLILRVRGDRRKRRPYDRMKDIQLRALCNEEVVQTALPEWFRKARRITRKLTKNGVYPEHSRRRRTNASPNEDTRPSQSYTSSSSSTDGAADTDVALPSQRSESSYLPLTQAEFFSTLASSGIISQEVLDAVEDRIPPATVTSSGAVPNADSSDGNSAADDALWVQVGDRGATNYDRRSLTTEGGTVNVGIIDLWMFLLYRRFSESMEEPQETAMATWVFRNGTPRQFAPATSTLSTVLQPLINGAGHFVGAIRHQGQLFYVDSLNLPMNETVRQSLNELFGPNRMYIRLGVQRQGADGNLCGLHVLAHMTELMLSESTPSQVAATNFDEGMM
ncbi:hypothetical protein FOL46_000760, partial [Perkinsus olseni]